MELVKIISINDDNCVVIQRVKKDSNKEYIPYGEKTTAKLIDAAIEQFDFFHENDLIFYRALAQRNMAKNSYELAITEAYLAKVVTANRERNITHARVV